MKFSFTQTGGKNNIIAFAVLAGLALVIFRSVIFSSGILVTTDDNLGSVALAHNILPQAFAGTLVENGLLGTLSRIPIGWTGLLLYLLKPEFFLNSFHALTLFCSSLIFFLFLTRRLGLNWLAALLGSLCAYWAGSNLTLVYAGHTMKFGVLLLAAAILFSLPGAMRSVRWAAFCGGLLGLMFLEQQDSALFTGILLGAYACFLLFRQADPVMKTGIRLAIMLLVSLMIALPAMLLSLNQNVTNVAALQESKQSKWEFCTQWSWPPEESIDFIAPGFTGWRSSEPEGPYWGRMGRSAEWEQTRQGFMNFKLENTYLGFLPIALALFGLAGCRRSRHRAEIIFWSSAAAVALLLSFGKYFPLYYAFWHLPVVNSIRNPNKFLQVFQLALGVMTAYGADALLSRRAARNGEQISDITKRKTGSGKQTKSELSVNSNGIIWFFWGLCGTLILIGFAALSVSAGREVIAAAFSRKGWAPDMASVIASNQGTALWHAFFMAAATTFAFAVFTFPVFFSKLYRFRNWIAGAMVLVVAADSAWLSRHYVKTMPPSYVAENAVTRLLKAELGQQRTAMVTQESFYNLWLTYLFPYHQITSFNITQMPRMPQDYKRFLATMGSNPLRMWQLSAVGYLLAPSGIMTQLPANQYKPVLRYDVRGNRDGNFSVQPRDTGSHVILRCLTPAPRYAIIGGSIILNDDQALARLAANDVPPFEKIILPPETSVKDPGGNGIIGRVEVLDYRPGHVRLMVESSEAGFLRAADKFDPDWKATVNGTAAEVLRADFIFQAIYIPAGRHEVELKYSPANRFLWMQFAGMAVCFFAGILLIAKRRHLVPH